MIRNIQIDRVLKKRIFNSDFLKNSIKDFKFKKINSYNKIIKNDYYQKNSLLTSNLIGQRIFVHNGREILSLKVVPSMVGFKIGEFFFNRKFNKQKETKKK